MALAGRPLLEHVLERVMAMPGLDDVVVATSTEERDAAVLAVSAGLGLRAWRGSETDVLARMRDAAAWAGADVVVRVTADCPFWDPDVGGTVLHAYLAAAPAGVQYLSNDTALSGYPDGLDTEVFSMAALEAAAALARRAHDREHVTPWMRTPWMRDVLRGGMVACATGDFRHLKLSVDTPPDYDRAVRIAGLLPARDFTLAATLAACAAAGEAV
jgi:spore coat polysaccharide biosynthesis protein SpsF (cytidylyltransferase family)